MLICCAVQGTTVHYRDTEYLVFDDKFGVSDNHFDIIPTAVMDDITVLTREHIPMLERMFELGVFPPLPLAGHILLFLFGCLHHIWC